MSEDNKSQSPHSPSQIRFKVTKTYNPRVQVQRIANLLKETNVTLFLEPSTPGTERLNIINETGMAMSGSINKHRRAPRQLWSDEEVERLKAAHDKYNENFRSLPLYLTNISI
ncbi:7972_t:CDS:2 [Entrophospora sp. SA101]|nr:13742_t:CDS:2 [Entrophospora sp. SA101]CAJ0887465.1 7972_t:CDS:2 [Entrophospora sp. SA101]